jgi:mannose-6-phosphate isomerase-like protein (cupin superfamily)
MAIASLWTGATQFCRLRQIFNGTGPEMPEAPPGKFMVDPYLEWSRREGVPVHEDFGFDLMALETAHWARFGVNGAIAHVAGRGDFMSVFVLEIPPGGKTIPQRHLCEETFLVLSGHGSCVVEDHKDEKHVFEWGPDSIFAPPLNARYQLFNGSGREPVRIALSSNLPAVLNLFHSESFVFDNPCRFPEREGGASHFAGEGDFIPVRPGKHMWETNFVPDAKHLELQRWAARGADASHIQLILADGVLHAHISEMPVGTYKKAHRHGPDVHVYCLSGEGLSLFWYEGDADFVRIDWRRGWVFAPPDMMYHQHFNIDSVPVRYLAIGHGSVRYPFTRNMWNVYRGVDVDVKKGGNQIEYENQDPRIHAIFTEELAKKGLAPRMDRFIAKAEA